MFSVLHLAFITATVIVFNIVGLFGNLNLIIATVREPSLRTKAGYLMTILCFLQTICLLSELGNLPIYWRKMAMAQTVCFRMNTEYLFSVIAQSVMYFVLSLDMLIAVAFPLRHRMWPTISYVVLMCIPAILIASAVFIIFMYYKIDDDDIFMCKPPYATGHDFAMAVTILLMITNTGAIVMVAISILIVSKGENELEGSRRRRAPDGMSTSSSSTYRMIRALSLVVAVFVCTWYLCVVSVYAGLRLRLNEKYMDYLMTSTVILAMLTFCQGYYVLWFHSPQYRRAFRQQLAWICSCSCDHLNHKTSSTRPTYKNMKFSDGCETRM